MAEFSVDLDLSAYQREQAVRHFEQTYHLNFGGLERQTANYFRVSVAECADQSAPAAALRSLTEAVRGAGPVRVKLAGFDKVQRARFSALLEQTAYRPGREGNQELATVLGRLWRAWDQTQKVPQDEYARAELIAYSGRAPASAAPARGVVG